MHMIVKEVISAHPELHDLTSSSSYSLPKRGSRLIIHSLECDNDAVYSRQSSEKRQNTLLHAVLARNTPEKLAPRNSQTTYTSMSICLNKVVTTVQHTAVALCAIQSRPLQLPGKTAMRCNMISAA